jgi:hypothetical protein
VGESLRTKVAQWAAESARQFNQSTRPAYESIHLDDLLGNLYSRESAIEHTSICVEVLCEAVKNQSNSFRVAIAMRDSAHLTTAIPSPETIREELHPIEPPSLYICRDIFTMYVPYFEEFRIPLEGLTQRGHSAIVCYYSCFRSLEAARLDEEYSRVVWQDIMTRPSDILYHETLGM